MFKKSRIKIIGLVMSVIIAFFSGMIAVIYTSSYADITAQNHSLLLRYADRYSLNEEKKAKPQGQTNNRGDKKDTPENAANMSQKPDNVPPDEKDRNGREPERNEIYNSVNFYSAAFAENGQTLKIDTSNSQKYDEETVDQICREILGFNKEFGHYKSYVYIVKTHSEYTLAVFMDNAVASDNIKTLVRYTAIFGCTGILFVFILSFFLSGIIMRPLEESYKKQKQFISDAGHELKTPVAVIAANAELLSDDIGQNVWLSNICYENEKMSLLIKQLLELSKTENTSAVFEDIDLSRLAMGEALPFESIAFEKGLELEYDIDENIHVSGSSVQLKQLIAIMIDNAVQHSDKKGTITLSLKASGKNAVFSVKNPGEEIPLEMREKIFERFYRGDASHTDKGGHYGLGLAIAKAVAQAHKGKINVKCECGKVEFLVNIPII
ncbi:MAG: HAMP domain-containing histidine kinase [Clostridia bacterium]|nr:HAMP domain-containing histidine kinase [Clostridia bacterium]